MAEYIKGIEFSSLFLLTCGAVVNEEEALSNLRGVVEQYVNPTPIRSPLIHPSVASSMMHLHSVQSASLPTMSASG